MPGSRGSSKLETLGPLGRISAGEALVHPEAWVVVFSGVSPPVAEDEENLLKALEPSRAKLLES